VGGMGHGSRPMSMKGSSWSVLVVTRPEGGVVEITVGQGRWWLARLLRDAGGVLLGAVLFGGFAALVMTAAGHVLRRAVYPQHLAAAAVVLFGLVVAAWIRMRVRDHAVRTTLRVTGRGVEVTVLGWFGRRTERAWRRDEVFEVRPSKGELHVRLARDHPFRLMRFHSKEEVREAAAAVRDALAEVPPVALPGDAGPVGGLTYEVAGRPYEIEIEQTADGLRVVVPEEGNRADVVFGPWMVGLTVLAFSVLRHSLGLKWIGQGGRSLSRSLMLMAAFAVGPALLAGIGSMAILRRWRGGKPLIIQVDGRNVRIDHPALLIRRRCWRRERVTEVIVDCTKGKGGEVIQHFVRMRVGARSVTFCYGRDGIEMRRVVTVLRNALGMPALPDSAFPEDGSAV
jgi:hypothetical protein